MPLCGSCQKHLDEYLRPSIRSGRITLGRVGCSVCGVWEYSKEDYKKATSKKSPVLGIGRKRVQKENRK